MNVKQRNSTVECLRIFFILGIILGHIYAHGSGLNIDWIYSLGENWATAYHLSLYSLGKLGVTGFMFISGYYGIKMNAKKWIDMLLMCISYFIVLSIVFGNYKGTVHAIHAWDAWWFLSAYFIVCLLAPLVESFFQRSTQKSITFLVIGLAIYIYWGHFMSMANDHDVVFLLTIYVVGRYLKNYPPPVGEKYIKGVFLTSLLLIICVPVLIEMLTGNHVLQKLFLSNNNILILTTTASMVVLADRNPFYSKVINWFASSVLAIYLITEWPEIRDMFNTYALPKIIEGWGFLLIPIVAIVCVLIESIRKMFFNKLTEVVINKYHNE